MCRAIFHSTPAAGPIENDRWFEPLSPVKRARQLTRFSAFCKAVAQDYQRARSGGAAWIRSKDMVMKKDIKAKKAKIIELKATETKAVVGGARRVIARKAKERVAE